MYRIEVSEGTQESARSWVLAVSVLKPAHSAAGDEQTGTDSMTPCPLWGNRGPGNALEKKNVFVCLEKLYTITIATPSLKIHSAYQRLWQVLQYRTLLSKPWWGGSVVGASTCTPKGGWFDPQSGHMPRFQAPFLVREATDEWSIFSLYLKINKNISSGLDCEWRAISGLLHKGNFPPA